VAKYIRLLRIADELGDGARYLGRAGLAGGGREPRGAVAERVGGALG
jgi:hypothetical protein